MTNVLRASVRDGIRAALQEEIGKAVRKKVDDDLKEVIEDAMDAVLISYEAELRAAIEEITIEALKPEPV